MFTAEQKRIIAQKVERALLEAGIERRADGRAPTFKLLVADRDWHAWAEIDPNWAIEDGRHISLMPIW